MVKKFKKFAGIVLYRTIARYLPASYEKLTGGFSKRFRAFCTRLILDECGSNVNIEKGADFALNIKIGNNSGIGKNSIVGAYTQIGDNVMMGEACFIYARNHKTDRLDVPMCIQGFEKYRPVVISDDVWIGARVTILPGAKRYYRSRCGYNGRNTGLCSSRRCSGKDNKIQISRERTAGR